MEGLGAIPQQPSDRLFFAVQPDVEAMVELERLVHTLCDQYDLKGRPLGRDRYHVTLHHIGDFAGLPQGVVEAARAAAASLTAGPPFELSFDRVASFSRRARNKPLVLLGDEGGVLALRAFQRALGLALMRRGLGGAVESRYTPHLTLLYDHRQIAEQKVEPVTWVAREFVLVRSLIGQSRHEVLARLPLRDE